MRIHFTIIVIVTMLFVPFIKVSAINQSLVWFDGSNAVTYSVDRSVSPVVKVALDMLDDDMYQVTGMHITQKKEADAVINIYQLDKDCKAMRNLISSGIPVDSLKMLKDAFFIKAIDGKLVVVGSNGRGTAYGILELSRRAGVSPWIWWGDVKPEKKNKLTVPANYSTFQYPSVEYRGIFLNDEDWSLQPWSWMHFSPSDKPGFISARTYKEIFKLLMRLRANAMWPGMHGMTTPFFMIPGAKEVADSCGIIIGTSHCEPMMRNNVGEWNVKDRGRYNYVTNKSGVHDYWIERLKEVKNVECFYTLGMRGIHDSGMEGVEGADNKTRALQQVINDQQELLKRYVNKDVSSLPQQFVPYKEVLQIMENGLEVPDHVTLTWCDDNFGYMTRLSDSTQQKRIGGGGIYYHLSYWGRPHDYMWLCSTQPGLVYNEMKEAYNHNVRKLWIVNVHDMKTPAYNLELFLDMAWNIHSISPTSINKHLENWLSREFGTDAGHALLPVMQEYYRLCNIRRPEFLGWNNLTLKNNFGYGREGTPTRDTEFSLKEFGGELDRHLSDWKHVEELLQKAEKLINPSLEDAFFSHVKYQVLCAAAMNEKMLEAQRARTIAAKNYNAARWKRDDSLYTACAKSQKAYQKIRSLTHYWNEELGNGKWKHSMCDYPRDLYVFYAPHLPVGLTEGEMEIYSKKQSKQVISIGEIKDSTFVACNAYQYTSADSGVETVDMLGHSMNAVSLPEGKTLDYSFSTVSEGECVLRMAVIPTHPNDKGDIRFSVSVDGQTPIVCSFKEGFRSSGWDANVLRGQSVKNISLNLKRGSHKMVIKALDKHVLIDQWMIDFTLDRKFYVFPIAPTYSQR